MRAVGLEGVPVLRGVVAAVREDVSRGEGHDKARLDRGAALVTSLGFNGHGGHVFSLHDRNEKAPSLPGADSLEGGGAYGWPVPSDLTE